MRYNGDGRYAFSWSDGLRAELDFSSYLVEWDTEITRPFRDEDFLAAAYLDHGVMTWPNQYDICTDVLRAWCEAGRILSQAKTDAHFMPFFAEPTSRVAEDSPPYGVRV